MLAAPLAAAAALLPPLVPLEPPLSRGGENDRGAVAGGPQLGRDTAFLADPGSPWGNSTVTDFHRRHRQPVQMRADQAGFQFYYTSCLHLGVSLSASGQQRGHLDVRLPHDVGGISVYMFNLAGELLMRADSAVAHLLLLQ